MCFNSVEPKTLEKSAFVELYPYVVSDPLPLRSTTIFPKKLMAERIRIRRKSRSHLRKTPLLSCILTWFRIRYHCAQPPFPKKLVADNIRIRRRSRSHMRKVLFLSCILTWFRLRYHCAQPPFSKEVGGRQHSPIRLFV